MGVINLLAVHLIDPWGKVVALSAAFGHTTGLSSWLDNIHYWAIIPVFVSAGLPTTVCWDRANKSSASPART